MGTPQRRRCCRFSLMPTMTSTRRQRLMPLTAASAWETKNTLTPSCRSLRLMQHRLESLTTEPIAKTCTKRSRNHYVKPFIHASPSTPPLQTSKNSSAHSSRNSKLRRSVLLSPPLTSLLLPRALPHALPPPVLPHVLLQRKRRKSQRIRTSARQKWARKALASTASNLDTWRKIVRRRVHLYTGLGAGTDIWSSTLQQLPCAETMA